MKKATNKSKSRSKTSRQWLKEHFNDPYVKQAQEQGYRSRAAFKLLEIQQKDKLIKSGMLIIDLGAAPGGWSQVATDIVGNKGKVIASDILPMDGLPGVEFIQGDFREQSVLEQLEIALQGNLPDLIISDIAPNTSGNEDVDQARAMYLLELVLDFAANYLKPGGNLIVKVFQGEGFDVYFKKMKETFKKMLTRKPKASRARSREVYLLGKGKL